MAKLLIRTGRGIKLTEAGQVLYTLCERVLNVWQEVSDEIDLAVMGQVPQEVSVKSVSFADNPTAFLSAPSHVLMHTSFQKCRPQIVGRGRVAQQ